MLGEGGNAELKIYCDWPKEQFILQYLHEIGRILWYRNCKKLANVVFHRLDLLTKLVKLIFYHSSEEKRRQHKAQSHNFHHSISCRKYGKMVDESMSVGRCNP